MNDIEVKFTPDGILNRRLYFGRIEKAWKVLLDNPDHINRVLSLVNCNITKVDQKKLIVESLEWEELEKISEEAFSYIDLALLNDEKVLIHCQNGETRSVMLVMAYLIRRFGISFQAAQGYVQDQLSLEGKMAKLSESSKEGLKKLSKHPKDSALVSSNL